VFKQIGKKIIRSLGSMEAGLMFAWEKSDIDLIGFV
jgi:hypothetical protein